MKKNIKVNLTIPNFKLLKRIVSCYNDILERNSLITIIFEEGESMKLYHSENARIFQCRFKSSYFNNFVFNVLSNSHTIHVACCILYKELSLYPIDSPITLSVLDDILVISSLSTPRKSTKTSKVPSAPNPNNKLSIISHINLMYLDNFDLRELDGNQASDINYGSISYNDYPRIVPFISRPNFDLLFICIGIDGIDFHCSNISSSTQVTISKQDLLWHQFKDPNSQVKKGLYNTKYVSILLSMLLKDEEVSMHINSEGLLIIRGKLASGCKFLYFLAPKIDEVDEEGSYCTQITSINENKELFKQQRDQERFKEDSIKKRRITTTNRPLPVQQPIQQSIQQPIQQPIQQLEDHTNLELYDDIQQNFLDFIEGDKSLFIADTEESVIQSLMELNNN